MTPKLYGTEANSNFMPPMFGFPTALSTEQLKSITRVRTKTLLCLCLPCQHRDTFRHLQGWYLQRDEDLALPDLKQNLEARPNVCRISQMNGSAVQL